MTTTKIYDINELKKLIEINENKTNFRANFSLKSANGEPFKALVISEKDLNSGDKIAYQDITDGYITGSISNDNGVFQTFFILLKSDKPIKCEVVIQLIDIPLNPKIVEQIKMEEEKKRILQQEYEKNKAKEEKVKEEKVKEEKAKEAKAVTSSTPEKKSSINWLLVIVIVIIIAGGCYWWFFIKNKKNAVPDAGLPQLSQPVIIQPPVELITPTIEPIPSVVEIPQISIPDIITPPVNSSQPNNNKLMSRLNNYFKEN